MNGNNAEDRAPALLPGVRRAPNTVRAENERLREETLSLLRENVSLQDDNRHLRVRNGRIEEVAVSVYVASGRLQDQITEVREENGRLLETCQNLRGENAQWQEQSGRLLEVTLSLQAENYQLQEQNREHRQHLQSAGQTILEAMDRYSQQRQELQRTQIAVRDQAEIHQRDRRIVADRTRDRVIELNLRVQNLEEQLDTARAEVADLQTQRAAATENHHLKNQHYERQIWALVKRQLEFRTRMLQDAEGNRPQQEMAGMLQRAEHAMNVFEHGPMDGGLEMLPNELRHAGIVLEDVDEDEDDGDEFDEDELDNDEFRYFNQVYQPRGNHVHIQRRRSSQSSGTLVNGSRANSEAASEPELFEVVTPSPNASPRPPLDVENHQAEYLHGNAEQRPYSASPRYSPRTPVRALASRSPSYAPSLSIFRPNSPVFAPNSPVFLPAPAYPANPAEASSQGHSQEQANRPSRRFRSPPTPYPLHQPATNYEDAAAHRQEEEVGSPQTMRQESVPRAGVRRSIDEFQEDNENDAREASPKRQRYEYEQWGG